jgi:hypothetical protein
MNSQQEGERSLGDIVSSYFYGDLLGATEDKVVRIYRHANGDIGVFIGAKPPEPAGRAPTSVVTDAMVERAARAVEKRTKEGYGWTDEEFEVWWNKDPFFVEKIKTWTDFQGTSKGRLLWETRIALEAALGEIA